MQKGKVTSGQHDGQSQLDVLLEQFRGFSTRGEWSASWSIDGDTKKLSLEIGSREPKPKSKSSRKVNAKPAVEPELTPPAIDTNLDDSAE